MTAAAGRHQAGSGHIIQLGSLRLVDRRRVRDGQRAVKRGERKCNERSAAGKQRPAPTAHLCRERRTEQRLIAVVKTAIVVVPVIIAGVPQMDLAARRSRPPCVGRGALRQIGVDAVGAGEAAARDRQQARPLLSFQRGQTAAVALGSISSSRPGRSAKLARGLGAGLEQGGIPVVDGGGRRRRADCGVVASGSRQAKPAKGSWSARRAGGRPRAPRLPAAMA